MRVKIRWLLPIDPWISAHKNRKIQSAYTEVQQHFLITMSSKEPPLSPRAEQLKALGNSRFKAAEYSKAFILYTAAIVEESNSPALFSNRSATAIKLRHPDQAISDAQRAIQVREVSSRPTHR